MNLFLRPVRSPAVCFPVMGSSGAFRSVYPIQMYRCPALFTVEAADVFSVFPAADAFQVLIAQFFHFRSPVLYQCIYDLCSSERSIYASVRLAHE